MDLAAEFSGLADVTYLNSCAYGVLPKRTREAMVAHMDHWTTNPDWDVWNETIEHARKGFARLIDARPEDIALQANATSGIASVMSALDYKSGRDRIVTTEIDFPTAPFLATHQKARGARQDHIMTQGAPLRVDEWRKHMGKDVALGCIPAIASFTGYRFDVKAFAEATHAAGAPLLVDAFQAAGTYPIDVKELDVDFLVTGVYKWLMGTSGLAFMYVRPDHHSLMPTTSGWYAQDVPYDFDPFGALAPDAKRFQYGGASIIGCAASAASFDLIHEMGLAKIERHNRRLVERVMDGARERKYEVLTPEAPHERASIVTFRVPDLERSLAALAREKVVVNSRVGGIRVSPHFYNTEADIDRLFAVLDASG